VVPGYFERVVSEVIIISFIRDEGKFLGSITIISDVAWSEPRLDFIGLADRNNGVGLPAEFPKKGVVGFDDKASSKIWSDAHDLIAFGAVDDFVSVVLFADKELWDGTGQFLVFSKPILHEQVKLITPKP